MPTEHWCVFLSIESDLEHTARFVEPREENDRCFSVEFARILMAAGAVSRALRESPEPSHAAGCCIHASRL